MKIEITDATSISEIKRKFHNQFPFLQLEFFNVDKEGSVLNPLQRILDESKKIGSLVPDFNKGEFSFFGEDKVSKIENEFREKLGLNVQVFRKSGSKWLLTTSTDEYSLSHQNELGKEMSDRMEPSEPYDIHEQE